MSGWSQRCLFAVLGELLYVTALVPKWPATYQMNRSTFVYVCNYSGYTDVTPDSVIPRFGIVAFDWSNAKKIWANSHPMDCEERLVEQAARLKKANTETKVFVYRNLVKALPWFSSVRHFTENPDYQGLFLKFNASNPTVPACDSNYNPPRCSVLYHDQVQTPSYPNSSHSKYDGTCSGPCDCGANTPCGEYLYDHRNASLQQHLLEFVMGSTGHGSGVIDGVSLDDGWSDQQQVGNNACDGGPIGGPSEVAANCTEDMNLTAQDVKSITHHFRANIQAVQNALYQVGGFTWPQFLKITTPEKANCGAFYSDACTRGTYLNEPLFHLFSEAAGRKFYPLPYLTQDLASFLLLRGQHAWIGYDWNSCSFDGEPAGGRYHQPFSFPSELNLDYGQPVELLCKEVMPGVFERKWSKATARFDCNTWQGSILWEESFVSKLEIV